MNTYRDISSLHNWEHNPRSVTKEGIERLKKQIQKLGQYKPLLITEDGTVLGGNMRLKAYQELGIKELWVSVVDAPTEEKKIEYALSDNDRVGKYEADDLANLIGNFPEVEWGDYSVDIKEPELVSELMDKFSETEEDDAPAVQEGEAESKLGEVYQLGRHRLMCGDSTDAGAVAILMNGQKADIVLTDPPYGMNLDTDYSKRNSTGADYNGLGTKYGTRGKYSKVIGDDKPYEPSHLFRDFGYVKDMFLAGADYYSDRLVDRDKGSWYVWDKRVGIEDIKFTASEFEMYWSKTKHLREIIRVRWFGAHGTQDQDIKKRSHPTQKPLGVNAWFIKKFTKENDIVVDIFGGTGSCLIACEQTNRTCYMMELDPHYCDVIRKRYDNFITSQNKSNAKQ